MSRYDRPLGGVDAGAEFESVRIIKRPTPETTAEAPPKALAPGESEPPAAGAPRDGESTVSVEPPAVRLSLAEQDELQPAGVEPVATAGELDDLGGVAAFSVEPSSESSADGISIVDLGPDATAAVGATSGLTGTEAAPKSVADEPVAPPVKPRSVIVIDADAPADLPGAGATDATGDRVDPRIRARRRQVQRAAGRKRFRVLIGVITAIVLLVGGSILIQSPLFSVRDVRIDGVHYADASAIRSVADSLYGQPLFRADLAKAQDTILLQPWVRRVRIIRTWPRSITIDIAERTPIGAVPTEDQAWRVIDIEGRVLAITEGQPKDFMAIRGDPKPVEVGGVMSSQMISGARLADSLPGRLKSITREVIVGGDGAVALEISPKGRILLGTIDDLRAKLISVLTFLDSCPGVRFETLDARAATALVMSPPNCHKPPLTKKAP